jgi:hypothetical protein
MGLEDSWMLERVTEGLEDVVEGVVIVFWSIVGLWM